MASSFLCSASSSGLGEGEAWVGDTALGPWKGMGALRGEASDVG